MWTSGSGWAGRVILGAGLRFDSVRATYGIKMRPHRKVQQYSRSSWFFNEPRRTSCRASSSVVRGEAEVHAVVRHFDGDWHFLSEASANGLGDGLVMTDLGFVVDAHPRTVPLYGMAPGWVATWDPSIYFWELVEMDEPGTS